jgi:hypothetical protein
MAVISANSYNLGVPLARCAVKGRAFRCNLFSPLRELKRISAAIPHAPAVVLSIQLSLLSAPAPPPLHPH